MDDPFRVAVLDRLADRHEQFQPLPGGESLPVAVLDDRQPLHQLHDEVRPAALGGTGVEHPGDIRGSIKASACRSASNRAMTSRESIPGLITFTATLQGPAQLLGDEHEPHSALADLFHQLVRADRAAHAFGHRLEIDRGGGIQEASHAGMRGEQTLNVLPDLGVWTGGVQIGGATPGLYGGRARRRRSIR